MYSSFFCASSGSGGAPGRLAGKRASGRAASRAAPAMTGNPRHQEAGEERTIPRAVATVLYEMILS